MAERIPTEKSKKKRQKEEEFFAEQEAKKLAELRKKLDKERSEAQKQHLKEQHWMRCPKCGEELEEIGYQNIMIDKCSGCGGMWLDAGELDILTKSSSSGFLQGLWKSVGK